MLQGTPDTLLPFQSAHVFVLVEVRQYYLGPTELIPNSPLPLLHYPAFLSGADFKSRGRQAQELFDKNDWEVQWLVRYGPTQKSHYHSGIHECMAVLSGTATIKFGAADTEAAVSDVGPECIEDVLELQAQAGDVFVIPAGVAHKTYRTFPEAPLEVLSPGDGHHDVAQAVEDLYTSTTSELEGFTMLGAYPKGHGTWDFATGGEHRGDFEQVWSTSIPRFDPILGKAEEGLHGLWQ